MKLPKLNIDASTLIDLIDWTEDRQPVLTYSLAKGSGTTQ